MNEVQVVNEVKTYIADTNVLLAKPEIIEQFNVAIPSHINREIEHLELTRKSDRQLQWQIRNLKRKLDDNEYSFFNMKDYTFTLDDELDAHYTDNVLLQVAIDENYGMITNDRLLRQKCKQFGIELINIEEDKFFVEHKGFREIYITQEEFDKLDTSHNTYVMEDGQSFTLLTNEYLVVNNIENDELLDIFKWDGQKLIAIRGTGTKKNAFGFKTLQFGDFVPKDEQQIMAVDSIFNNQITSIRGQAGSGKSLIALSTAWRLVEEEQYKLVIFVNPVPSRDAQELGFYTGNVIEKLMQSSVGAMLKSKFGSDDEIIKQIQYGKIEILPFVDLRGYDTGGTKTIVWIVEAQNLTSDLLKLGLQRIAGETKAIIDGDYHLQVDKDIYASNNGMRRMSEVFRGDYTYAEIELQNVWRSHVAELAEKM